MVIKPLDEFEDWCKVRYGSWWVDDADLNNPIIHVHGDATIKWAVNLIQGNHRIPYTFGEVSGNFECYGIMLKDLTGTPRRVGGKFDAGRNPLTSLKGGPEWVGGGYHVDSCNDLVDVQDVAAHVGQEFEISWNKHLRLLKPFMNSQSVRLHTPRFSSWEDDQQMKQVQDILDDHAGEGRAGAIKVAAKLIRMGLPECAKM
jgi:hypothetical protein